MKQIILDLTKPSQTIEITEDSEVLGLFIGRDHQQIQTLLNVVHNLPHVKSLTAIKAVIYDDSRFDMEGKLIINKGAKDTDSYLRIDVLIMSEGAYARAVPGLEITENDVNSGHGATVGQVDKEQLFYLQSRGLTKSQAEQILVEGFVKDLLDRIKEPKIKAEFNSNLGLILSNE
jgi:Fe-S cluster assembly protein SufD